jgi:alpha-D-xyloside xylohydrolase
VAVETTEKGLAFTTGKLRVEIPQDAWDVRYTYDGRYMTGSTWRSTGYVTATTGETYMKEDLSLSVGELVYGLGERFTPFVKNGQEIDIWNRDGGTSSEQAYKNIPFYLTSKGYGVLVNDAGLVRFEVGSEKVERVQFSQKGEYLDYFIIGGGTPQEVLKRYAGLTGHPALPPAWSFGLWLTTSFTTDYDEATVTGFTSGMAERGIPLQVFHFDCFWMRGSHWCDFVWDPQTFPDPAAMIARMKAQGLKICVWINPYIAQRSRLFTEGKQKGYLLRKTDGSVWQGDEWQPGMGIVDFTNPAACDWYAGELAKLMDMGVDTFKTDFGERIPHEGVVYHDGSNPAKMHNYYTQLYNKVVFELLENRLGKGKAVVFARSATAGGQQYPVHWGGDCFASYESMAESLRGGLSLGLCGFGFWSHDMGGFESTSTADLYKRWVAFGMLSSHSRLHGSGSYRVPWLYDEESVDVLRHFTKLKLRLMPYLYQTAVAVRDTGVPTMRAMILEYPDDPTCAYLDRQYFLGKSLLVAPIFSETGEVEYYLPQGNWTHLLTGETTQGGWRRETYDYLGIPLWVRENTILPMGAHDTKPEYDYADGLTLHLFAIDGTVRETVYDTDGNAVLHAQAARQENTLTITLDGGKNRHVCLRSIHAATEVQGATCEKSEQGLLLKNCADMVIVNL